MLEIVTLDATKLHENVSSQLKMLTSSLFEGSLKLSLANVGTYNMKRASKKQPQFNNQKAEDSVREQTDKFRPSDFMRARRPELFSDSIVIGEPTLPREVFEYHLDTLTSRKQETEFEHFCRRLAEKELCPNLVPQTGPTGGGDSKVDAETYPVSEQIALRWYEGIAQESSDQRWAFAFSAKKDWRSKVGSDVGKIVSTQRNYGLVYFITNQFIKDKTRTQVQEELERKHNIKVWLLDRTWIMKCVFENDRIRIALETLNLTGYNETSRKVIGPYDAEREIELTELEEKVNDVNRYGGVEYQLAEDCLQTALLARGLNHPRTEIDGRFQRAERIARKVNHQQQLLRIAYAKAWTAFWWYDDFEEVNQLYEQVELLATGSSQATDLELLANIWILLHTIVRQRVLDDEATKLALRTQNLKANLERLIDDKERPNNALLARINRLLVDLNEALGNRELVDTALIKLKEALIASKGLADCPIQPVMQIIRELGEYLTDSAKYDELFEVVVTLTEQRTSQGEVGAALLERGKQKLQAGKRYDAIQLLGRAQEHLTMHEYREEWFTAVTLCAVAYEGAGLLWAARSNMLTAASQALSEYLKHGEIPLQTIRCLQQLVWLELQLGRVFCALAWLEFVAMIANQLSLEGELRERFIKERETQDLVLGMLLLKTDIWELKWLDFLPNVLDEFGLYHSRMTLLYALGYEELLRSEGTIPEEDNAKEVKELFVRLLDQPANSDLPIQPEFMRSKTIKLHTFVLGCEVTIAVTNISTSVYLAETILGALEALLATSLDGELFPYRSELQINIQPSDSIRKLPEYEINEIDSEQTILIRHNPLVEFNTIDEREGFRAWLLEFILKTTSLFATSHNSAAFIKQIEADEGIGRAIGFSEVAIPIHNLLGRSPKFRLSDWTELAGSKRFSPTRSTIWSHDLRREVEPETEDLVWQMGEGSPPESLFGIDNLKHKDRRIFSLINMALWDKAGWDGIAYLWQADLPPLLCLIFKNSEAGKQIFAEWRRKIGAIDEEEQLRVSIITGVNDIPTKSR